MQADPRLQERYHGIRFNMPHNRASFESGEMQQLMKLFFQSAATKQNQGDKVYVVIPQLSERSNPWYACYYGIYHASISAGYNFYRKRKFSETNDEGECTMRYPGYEHRITNGNAQVPAASNSREYVFIKTLYTPEELVELTPPKMTEKLPHVNILTKTLIVNLMMKILII